MYAFQHGIIASGSGGGAINTLWDGLLAYYTADNTPNDALGTYNGTLVNGATYGTGIINEGFSLDGVNDYVNFGNVLDFDGSTPFSFNFWANPSVVGNKNIINKWTNLNTGYIIYFYASKIEFAIQNTSPTNALLVNTVNTYSTGMQMFTITYDGSKTPSGIKIYQNANNQTLNTVRNTLTGSTSTTADFNLGRLQSGVGWYDGILDEIGCWGRVLTPTEVTELYNSGAGKQY